MRREELEHIIRSAGAILGDPIVIIIGSQSILGTHPDDAPPQAILSVEADILPIHDPDGKKADLIDGTIGEGSPFQDSFGVYGQGVAETTARLPKDWRQRLVPIRSENTLGVTGQCLEPHDLLIAKYFAGRPKDLNFTAAVVSAGLVQRHVLLERLEETTATSEEKGRIRGRIDRDFLPTDSE